jgi:hypothetical protein
LHKKESIADATAEGDEEREDTTHKEQGETQVNASVNEDLRKLANLNVAPYFHVQNLSVPPTSATEEVTSSPSIVGGHEQCGDRGQGQAAGFKPAYIYNHPLDEIEKGSAAETCAFLAEHCISKGNVPVNILSLLQAMTKYVYFGNPVLLYLHTNTFSVHWVVRPSGSRDVTTPESLRRTLGSVAKLNGELMIQRSRDSDGFEVFEVPGTAPQLKGRWKRESDDGKVLLTYAWQWKNRVDLKVTLPVHIILSKL